MVLKPLFLLSIRGPLASLDTLLVVTTGERGAAGLWGVETTDAAPHPTMHRTAPTTKKDPTESASSAEVEKYCSESVK